MSDPAGPAVGTSVPDLIDDSEVGIFAVHPVRATLPVLVAPTTDDAPTSFNAVRPPLVTVGCANLPDDHFAFDSSVLAPEALEGFKKFGALLARAPGSPAALFGHADPDGKDLYNKFLSERRARAVYAVLRRDIAIWEALFEHQEGAAGDVWGTRSIQVMLQALGDFPGAIDGKDGQPTRDAIKQFQSEHADERPGPKGLNSVAFRKVLFKAYMDFLCRRPTKVPAGQPEVLETYQMAVTEFLSGGKSHLTGDFQGCSSFNPQLLLSQSDLDGFADGGDEGEAARRAAHAADRRVLIFLFRPGTQIDPAQWPCPRASEGVRGCLDRFWSDGKQRRGTHFLGHGRRFGGHVPASQAVLDPDDPALARRMAKAETTFACRFYHGVAIGSPCERDLKVWLVRLTVYAPPPDDGTLRRKADANQVRRTPVANARYVVIAGETANAAVIRGTTTADGVMMVPVLDDDSNMLLKVDAYEALYGPVFTPPDPPASPPLATTDPDAFPDEADFLTVRLGGGALKRAIEGSPARNADFDPDDPPPDAAETDLGVRQRLFNLGFGPAVFSDLGAAETQVAVAAFQREQAKDQKERDAANGVADRPTRLKLVQVHGS